MANEGNITTESSMSILKYSSQSVLAEDVLHALV